MPPSAPLDELTEKELTGQVIGTKANPGIARRLGWLCYHTLRSKGSQPGFPDWTIVRDRVVFLELKTERGSVAPAQHEWLRALVTADAEVYLIRPRHLELLAAVLSARQTRPGYLPGGAPAANTLRAELTELLLP